MKVTIYLDEEDVKTISTHLCIVLSQHKVSEDDIGRFLQSTVDERIEDIEYSNPPKQKYMTEDDLDKLREQENRMDNEVTDESLGIPPK